RPDKIGENQGQQPGGQHQHDEDSDRPKLQIASGKLLNLLLDIFRTRQHRRLNVFLVPRLCHPPSGKNSAGSVLNACTLSPNGTLTLKILTYQRGKNDCEITSAVTSVIREREISMQFRN